MPTHAWYKRFLGSKRTKLGGLDKELLEFGTYLEGSAVEIVRFGTETQGTQIVPGMGPFESHHIIPKYIQKKLQACLQETWNIDDIPAVLETRPDHWFPKGLHADISAQGIHWNQMNSFSDDAAGAKDILDRLETAYGPDGADRPELVKVVQEWRAIIERQ